MLGSSSFKYANEIEYYESEVVSVANSLLLLFEITVLN